MSTNGSPKDMWAAAMIDAAQAPLRAGAAVTGLMLLRQRHASRLEGALQTAQREVETLIESAQRLKRALDSDGVCALTSGNNFEAEARHVADALVTLAVQREAFGAAEATFRREQEGG
jgi:hypothetical protein